MSLIFIIILLYHKIIAIQLLYVTVCIVITSSVLANMHSTSQKGMSVNSMRLWKWLHLYTVSEIFFAIAIMINCFYNNYLSKYTLIKLSLWLYQYFFTHVQLPYIVISTHCTVLLCSTIVQFAPCLVLEISKSVLTTLALGKPSEKSCVSQQAGWLSMLMSDNLSMRILALCLMSSYNCSAACE